MDDTVISRIQAVMAHYDLTVSAFADQIGVQRSSVSHVLSGRNKPSMDVVMKMVKTFPEVNLYWLLNGKGSFPAEQGSQSPTSTSAKGELPTDNIQVSNEIHRMKGENAKPVKIIVVYDDGTFESYDTKNR